MKIMKKTLTFLLVAVLLLSVSMVGFAAGTPTGSITVQDNTDTPHNGAAISDATYTAYQILELESYNKDNNAYLYSIPADWKSFFTTPSAGATYFDIETVDGTDYAIAKTTFTETAAPEFAAAALKYAEDNHLSGTTTLTGLDLGYYLVDTTIGSLCALTTTNPTATVEEKNVAPTITKEANTDNARIGETVTFTITVNVKKGAENYVVHDTMTTGLTFNGITSVQVDSTDVPATNYTVKSGTAVTDGCTFEIEFKNDYISGISGKAIVIKYTATLNTNAVVDGANTNTTHLTYGDNHTTVNATASVTTYQFHLVKTDKASKLLTGAKFRVYTAETGGTEIPLVLVTEAAGSYYRPAVGAETGVEIEAGNVTIKGLAKGTYYLEETAAPTGYNKLTSRVTMDMTSGSNTAVNMDAAGTTYANGGQQIVNNAGTLLPSTGGMGTTVFYVLGSIFAIGALVILVTRKRMAN